MINLNDLAQKIHENAKEKGFWESPRDTSEVFMLIVSELGEVLEADRSGKRADIEKYNDAIMSATGDEFKHPVILADAFIYAIKDTFEDEIADVVIRTLDYCGFAGISITHSQIEDNLDLHYGGISDRMLSITGNLFYAGRAAMAGDDEGVQGELWAAIDKCFSLAVSQGFDLMRHIELKMQYNATRERLHGKKY